MKFIFSILIIVLLFGCDHSTRGESDALSNKESVVSGSKLTHVEITKIKDGKNNYTYGWMEEDALKKVVSKDIPIFVKIYNAYWYDDYGPSLHESAIKTGVYYMKIDTLFSISELKEVDINKLRKEEEEAGVARKKAEDEKSKNSKGEIVP